MGVYAAAERMMRMDDRVWDRHANPLSGWGRAIGGPLLILAVWSRVWLGWWALVPVGLVILWTAFNTRLFPPPADYGGWMSRAVLGERIWLARDRFDVPDYHRMAANLATALSLIGIVPLAWGLWALDAGWTAAGAILCFGAKFWFLDRMVWLHADVTGSAPGTPLPRPVPFTGDEP